MPLYDLYAQIVYALKGADVETVVVGGRPVMRNRRVLTLDEPTIMARVREYGVRIKRSLTSPWKGTGPGLARVLIRQAEQPASSLLRR